MKVVFADEAYTDFMVTQKGLIDPPAAGTVPSLSLLIKAIKQKLRSSTGLSSSFFPLVPATKTDGYSTGYGTPNRSYAEHLLPASLVALLLVPFGTRASRSQDPVRVL